MLSAVRKRFPISSSALNRPSQVVGILNSETIIFSGELQPRIPLPADVHAISLSTGLNDPQITGATSTSPLGNNLYVFGGRGGKARTSVDRFGYITPQNQSGIIWIQSLILLSRSLGHIMQPLRSETYFLSTRDVQKLAG